MPIRHLALLLLLLLLLLSAGTAAAAEIHTPAGRLELPEGFVAHSPAGLAGPSGRSWSFVREGEALPRALFTMTVMPVAATHGVDARVAAAQLGDPMMLTPDGRPARRVRIGGERGWRHSTVLGNGLVVTAFAADRDGQRLLVQLRYPGLNRYRADAERFERAVRDFRWDVAAAGDGEHVAGSPEEDAAAAAPAPADIAGTALEGGDVAEVVVLEDPGRATIGVLDDASGLPGAAAPAAAAAAGADAGPADLPPGLAPVWSDVRRIPPPGLDGVSLPATPSAETGSPDPAAPATRPETPRTAPGPEDSPEHGAPAEVAPAPEEPAVSPEAGAPPPDPAVHPDETAPPAQPTPLPEAGAPPREPPFPPEAGPTHPAESPEPEPEPDPDPEAEIEPDPDPEAETEAGTGTAADPGPETATPREAGTEPVAPVVDVRA